MDIDELKELAKTVAESLDLSKVKGDFNAFKYVEHEIGNVEPNGIGIQINNYGSKSDGCNPPADSATGGEKETMERAEVLTGNKEFMLILQKAVNQGFCRQDGWQYKWSVKVEAAYFASLASERFNLSKRKINGKPTVSWVPFEALFGLSDLRTAFSDYKQCKTALVREEEIDKLFE